MDALKEKNDERAERIVNTCLIQAFSSLHKI
jgi:hypothetical protein